MKKAFTLIELLAVIAIIGVLAAILIPVLGSVKESKQRVMCVSNLRQLGIAVGLFVSEKGYLPGAVEDGKSPSQTWHTRVEEYIPVNGAGKDQLIESCFLCPSAEDAGEVFYVGKVPPSHKLGGFYSSYAYNWLIELGTPRVSDGKGLLPFAVSDGAGDTILIIDGGKSYHLMPSHAEGTSPDLSRVRYWHGGEANALFCDGHVGQIEQGTDVSRLLTPDSND